MRGGEHVVVRRNEDDAGRGARGRQEILKVEAAQATEVNVEDDAIGLVGDVAI